MAAIYLIRHGQASFDIADYDHLSEKGFKQAEILGKYWRDLPHPAPDKVYRGGMLRHQQTMDNFLNALESTAHSPIIHPGFNEYDHVEVLNRHRPDWPDISNPAKLGQIFEGAFRRWQSGEYDAEYDESWPQFKRRCVNALEELIQQAGDAKTLLVFTSGGTISVMLQHILELSDQHTMRFNQQIRNASVSKLLFSGERLGVDYINNFSHLEQAGTEWETTI
ncbi:hypothetical protein AB833_00280 [Chromatiales bacterium (ex Bugula neritina AB1)]|nr:hypothetical protein AB833_00280 [Chromatiales bacterium (ex Bugula neritina AB1)]